MLNKRGGPNKQGGLVNFFVYYMKNKGRVSKFLKLNKRVYPFIKHLRVPDAMVAQNSSSKMWLIDNCV